MISLSTPWRPASPEEMEDGADAFVAAVIREHERVQRNLRRLAARTLWSVDSEARTDRQIIEAYLALHRRSP
jgi:hypothetical protein